MSWGFFAFDEIVMRNTRYNVNTHEGFKVMTLTIDLTPEQEAALRHKAELAGLDISEYAVKLIEEGSYAPQNDPETPKSLLESLTELGVIGMVKGTSGPGDGRAWSEIEAACDPL